ncbi:HlyD family efflux transporter periplasmic adaptor subunit [Malaciobacter mytili]|uniref:HlyD family secretion protein n=1 Tax=Malaciobacter mytili LMG 24559 TaxID=1032238 RepID=A0AAX2AJ14_9BACT|nr:HlyD family efflux transporter periplasmic adaptor subunit [Malaciobacter mytili]AXH15741.1 RND family efflux system, membrane fusion protein [Malaciobacter mytili LMG 24559]RXI41151.1 HlyD family secretion protein [Malaciobacter mytili]RXK15436.1 HlyD family secretion protein [Malaciobacter mytili LMG 24559]
MRLLVIFFFTMNLAFASVYYAKLEPINSYQIKASVSGKVIFSNDELEGKLANNSTVIELDSYVDRVDLEQTKNKLKSINNMISIEQRNFERLTKVSSKSEFEKDTQKIKVINLETSKADTLIKIANLEDSIKNKKLVEKSNYIYNINVKEGDYVTPGTLLYEAKDLSKGKLEIFIPIADIEDIKTKNIYIDDKKSDIKITKIYDVADSEHISSYKVEIHIKNPKKFSRLIKIEFK